LGIITRIRQFGYMNLYGGMMVFNNMEVILLKRIVSSYRWVDVTWRMVFNNMRVILLKRISHFESTVHIGRCFLKGIVASYRLVDLKWQMVFNNMRVILLKRMCHLKVPS